MEITLQPKQGIAFGTEATETLFGGAVGGGKSYLLRTSAIRWCVEVAGIQVYLFRRTLPDLRDNHLRGPTSFHAMLAPYVEHGHVRYRAVENEFAFWNGSVLHLCYCDSENDVEKYRGAEIHVLSIDELTHFSDFQYRFLRSRVRIAGLPVPAKYLPLLPRIEAASNPGSIGHAWVKRTFISPKPPLEVWRCPSDEGGMLRQFIPARLSDNPYLTRDDPAYADRLRGLGADSLVRAMLDGDWDIVAGQAFEKLQRKTHCIAPFTPPADWLCFGSFDWGSSRPFSFGMWAVANGNALPDGRVYRRGAMIRWNEWYGYNGKPNEGLRMEAADVAVGIRKKIADCGVKLAYVAADPSMWKVDGGPSIAETFLRNGVTLRKADNSRLVGYVQLRGRISGDEEGFMLLATENCHAGFWRTMPDIVMDENKTEDIDTDQEDHCFVADTPVRAYDGSQRIGDLVGTSGKVLSSNGRFEKYHSCRMTRRNAAIVELTFSDGTSVKCTPDHRFMLESGQWCQAKNLIGKNALSLSAKPHNSFSASFIGSAGFTSSEKARGYIARFGNITTGLSQKVSMFTTWTKTAQTTIQRILQCWTHPAIYRFMAKVQPEPLTAVCTSIAYGYWQANGMEARKVWLGTESITSSIAPRRFTPNTSDHASAAEKRSLGKPTQRSARQSVPQNSAVILALTMWNAIVRFAGKFSIAINIASRKLALLFAAHPPVERRALECLSLKDAGKADVYCLEVPATSAFVIKGGLVAHNCADDCRYAAMSRPWMRVVKVDKPKVRDWNFEKEDEGGAENSWKVI